MIKKIGIIIVLIAMSACGQNYNSHSSDEFLSSGTFGIDVSTAQGQRLFAAFTVLNNQCISCHSGRHDSYLSLNTDALWIASGLVIKGDSASSTLIQYLKNNGGTMPKSAPQISSDELQALEDWIVQMP